MAAKKKVVIVGAGAAGMVSLKEHLAAGSDAICLEMGDCVGGVFSTKKDACYDGLFLTTSNIFMSFSDLPWPKDYIRYSPKEEYSQYLELYADHFDLRRHIRFHTRVEKAEPNGEKWIVRTDKEDFECDVVVVATGANSKPKPLDPVAPGFTGMKMHSQDFQNAAPFKDQHVLVIGTGESATDISADLCTVAASTTVWSRRPFLIAPRFPELIMNDTTHDEYQIMNDESRWRNIPLAEFLEFMNTSRIFNYCPLWQWAFLRQSFWEYCQDPKSKAAPAFKGCSLWSQMLAQHAPDSDKHRAYWQADQAAFATKNSRIASMVALGKVRLIISKNAEFGPSSVTFTDVIAEGLNRVGPDESCVRELPQVDAIVCCIGYATTIPFLDMEDLGLSTDPRTWYKHCFPSSEKFKPASLAMIGFARGHQGGIPQLAELLARYHALLVAGVKHLPANYADLAKDEGDAESNYFLLTPGLRALVDYPSFADSIARLIGCNAPCPNPLWEPAMFIKYWIYPMWPCWFRLRGPGANKEAALTVLKDRFPLSKVGALAPPPWIATGVVIPITLVCNLVTRIFNLGTRGANLGRNFLWNRSKMFILHGNTPRLLP